MKLSISSKNELKGTKAFIRYNYRLSKSSPFDTSELRVTPRSGATVSDRQGYAESWRGYLGSAGEAGKGGEKKSRFFHKPPLEAGGSTKNDVRH